MSDQEKSEVGPGYRGVLRYDTQLKKFIPVEKEKKPPVDAPYVITDEIPPTECMSNDRREMFTSASKLRRQHRSDGFIETGGERLKHTPPKKDNQALRDDVARAINAARYNEAPLTEKEKEQCRREEREYQRYKKRQEMKRRAHRR